MSMRFMTTAAVASTLFAFVSGVPAQTAPSSTTTTPTPAPKPDSSSRLVAAYTAFAGSAANAKALVQGLETGGSVTLQPAGTQPAGTPAATFTPATAKLSAGDANTALALAKAELNKLGITQPTPAQLQAALNGGTVTPAKGTSPVVLKGVLAARASGQGWGQIAHALGFKLGAVISASKSEHAGKKEHEDKHERAEHEIHHAKPAAHDGMQPDAAKSHGAAEGSQGGAASAGSHAGNAGGGSGHGGGNGGGSKK